jgi:ribonuclease-3
MGILEMAHGDPVFPNFQKREIRGGVTGPMAEQRRDKGRNGSLETLAEALGHRFARPELLAEAMTHRSAARAERHRFGYERLEFLGDRVLGLVIADLLLENYPDAPEGDLSRRLSGLVRREALEEVAASLDLGRFLTLAEGEARAGGRENAGILADACEATIGALYLDGGLAAARRFILAKWRPLLDKAGTAARDPKTCLQEWAQARKLPLPDYRVVTESGPAHDPMFTIEAVVKGEKPARAKAGSKRSAEQEAARKLLARINGGSEGHASGIEGSGDE